MFEGIGKIGSYAKQWKLKRMAKTKITTGQTVDLNKRQSFSSVFAQIGTQNTKETKKTTISVVTAEALDYRCSSVFILPKVSLPASSLPPYR